MVVCASCNAENPEGARFCNNCGASLAAPAPERRKLATSVFCDLSGSTALAERIDAEALLGLMASYYERARMALERHGGLVEKFIGDAVVGLFGVPEAHEDDALRACRAALEIQARVGELAQSAAGRHRDPDRRQHRRGDHRRRSVAGGCSRRTTRSCWATPSTSRPGSSRPRAPATC